MSDSRETYSVPFDVRMVLKAYPVTKENFSKALLKVRYDQMDDETQRRAERTLLSLMDGRYFK
jgi:hypothetical protein